MNEAQIFVQLVPQEERRATQQELMARLRDRSARCDLPLDEFAVEEVAMIRWPAVATPT